MVAQSPVTLCYIVSPSYSGSTLLTFLLNIHPQIATVGELKARNDQEVGVPKWCSCGEPMKECTFWRRLAAEFERRDFPFDITDFGTHFGSRRSFLAQRFLRARIRGDAFESLRHWAFQNLPGPRQELSRVLTRNRLLTETILQLQGGKIFLDSSKDPIRLKLMLRSESWNIKVIHLLRDGRGTARSFMRRTGTGMRKAALRFRRPHEQIERLAVDVMDDSWLRVRYENLACKPEETLEKISHFLGLEAKAARLDFRSVEHHILGNPMRLRDSSEIVLEEAWRTDLTNTDLEIFERFGGEMNRRLGYSD